MEIARCRIMEAHLEGRGRDQKCKDVVLHQWHNLAGDLEARRDRWRREHHAPVPWVGHLETAPILFVSSNPNLTKSELRDATLKEPIPEPEPLPDLNGSLLSDHPSMRKPFRAAKPYWEDDEVVDVFDSQFDVWVKPDGIRLFSANPVRRRKPVPFWEFAREQAQHLVLDRDVLPGRHYALTEVVHCGSAGEKHVTNALRPCVNRYLKAVLRASPARVVFIVGAHAARAIEILDGSLVAGELAPNVTEGRPGACVAATLAGAERFLVYVPHPGWLRRNPSTRSRYELPALLDQAQIKELHAAVAEAEGVGRETARRLRPDDTTP